MEIRVFTELDRALLKKTLVAWGSALGFVIGAYSIKSLTQLLETFYEMARWDEILTLPVQNPPTLEFSSADIVWSRVEGWQEGVDRVALIPFSRVNDFVRGESNMKECPTRFHVEARRRRPPEMPYKPKVDGILEYILYWCSFGPDDHRKGGIIRPSRNYSLKRKTPAGRPSTKRGCVCHFIVKRLIAEPSVALIIYNFEKHVDKQGLPCHGPQDKKAVGTHAMFAPYISEELRLQVMSLLYVGVPVETIMQRHTESVEKQGGPCNRDDLLTHRYVRRLERKIRRSTYALDSDDAVSISLWVEARHTDVFFYKDFSDSEPFVLGIQTEWQLQQMICFGNRSLVAFDSRFGTNKLKYPVQSLLVFDLKNNAIPVAWIITPKFSSGDTHRWLRALYDRVYSKDPTWRLGGFIVDDPLADIHLIREVFQCSVSISFWRVRHAWHKNLIKKCPEKETCVEISRRLGKTLSSICRESSDMDSFDDFLDDFVDCSDFMDYFKAAWFPRLGAWVDALKTLPLATVESSAAIECYHHQMKLRLLNEKDLSVYQRADWLVYKLGTKVHSYYWLDEYAEKDSFARYWKDEWKSGLTSWHRALKISDSDLTMGRGYADITNKKNQGKVHRVWNPGSEFAICECSWSQMGNLCKHVIKASKVYREKGLAAPSISLNGYGRTLTNILCCPPHDSLIRDHAVALAISVQGQITSLLDLENDRVSPLVVSSDENQPTAKRDSCPCSMTESGNAELANQNLSSNMNENDAEEAVLRTVMDGEGHFVNLDLLEKGDNEFNDWSISESLEVNVAGESGTGGLIDDASHHVQISSTDLVSTGEKQVDGDVVTRGEFSEDRAGNLSMKSLVSDTDNPTDLTVREEPLAELLEEARSNEVIVSSENNNDACEDDIPGAVTHKVMDIDPEGPEPIQTSPSTLKAETLLPPDNLTCQKEITDQTEQCFDSMIVDSTGAQGTASNTDKAINIIPEGPEPIQTSPSTLMSEPLINGHTEHCFDSMIVDLIEAQGTTSSVKNGTAGNGCSVHFSGNVNLDQKGSIEIESHQGDVTEIGYNKGKATGAAVRNDIVFGNADMKVVADTAKDENHKTDETKAAINNNESGL